MYHDGNADASMPSGGKEHAEAPPPLMLRLNKDVVFMDRVWTALFQKPERLRLAILRNDLARNPRDMELLKVARVPATLIRIGSWQFASEHEGDLLVKFYFATEILAWEVLMNGIQYKMEIRWSDISSIRATIEENKPGILEIELDQPPTFYKETDPLPRHYSLWLFADDFAGGQALRCRRHHLEFPSAALDRNYIKLLSSNHRLLELSQSSFPSGAETTFCMLQHSGFENSQMTRECNNLCQFEALLPPPPAAAADSGPHLREHLNSPYVGEAAVPT
ncbi:hypothetical protein ACJRO7_033067 [Eucalyptus globulus]|uniref:TRF2/HOY1 PH-like domain-containing protein n=1 Tax=Eucalyptus globulus TaxID=34317 RepID=A0ABD3JLK5_EUCGL